MEATSLLGKSDSNSSSSNLHTSSQPRSRRGRKKSKRKKEQQRQPEEAEAEGDPTSATGLMEEDEDDGEGEDELLVEKEEALRRFKSNTLKGDECPICLEVFTKGEWSGATAVIYPIHASKKAATRTKLQ
jgi:hypothetical protein